jgi:hypothetical protein
MSNNEVANANVIRYTQNNSVDKCIRLLIFVLFSFVFVRYALGLELTDWEQTKIVLAVSASFMFVNTYYPVIMTPK